MDAGLTEIKDLIVIGPGSIQQAHRPDEWISLEQLEKGVDLFEKFFRRFATQYITNLTTPSQEAITLAIGGSQSTTMHASVARAKASVEFRRATTHDVHSVMIS